jgi:DNA-binding response OmpR family regulator
MVRPIRILLVEDDYIIRISLNNALVEAGFEVSDAARGVMAIAEVSIPRQSRGL